jgi:sulfite exporter TauE/SafE
LAAASVNSLALAGTQVAALKPLWMLLHVFVFAWGAMLAIAGRQPAWARRIGRTLETRLRSHAASTAWSVLATGALWVAMPCGLLYSALLLASLGNGPLQGALAMVLFAIGSGLSLVLAPWLWQRLRRSGVLLAAVALQALWADLSHQIGIWCR